MAMSDIPALARQACDEIAAVFTPATTDAANRLCDEIERARRIACYGVGREGLMMRAFCMRLMHLGFDAHVVGDMTTPPVGAGDLLMVSAGPGSFSTVLGLLGVAHEAGARTLVITAQPGGEAARRSDVTIHLPAQTMADDRGTSDEPAADGQPVRSRAAHLFRPRLDPAARTHRANTGGDARPPHEPGVGGLVGC